MRFRPAPFVLFLASALASVAADFKIVRVWPSHRTAESFDRISEYFGGGESSARHTVLRTRAGDSAGYYFLVRLVNPGAARPRTFAFAAGIPAGQAVFELGLTGADWPDAKTEPVAWRLVLQSADGRELVSQQSFLWDRAAPPAK
jgi:hypothetical protein